MYEMKYFYAIRIAERGDSSRSWGVGEDLTHITPSESHKAAKTLWTTSSHFAERITIGYTATLQPHLNSAY